MTKLTDLEICKRLADIECKEFYLLQSGGEAYPLIKKWEDSVFTGKGLPKKYFTPEHYNPLTDDALCFKLMVKYKVEAEFYPDDTVDARVTDLMISRVRNNVTGENLNHAVCLAIIEAHK